VAEVLLVEVAHGDDCGGLGDPGGQLRVVDVLVEDVLRVQGDRVGDPRDPRRQARHPGRHRAEVGVQVRDATLPDHAGEQEGLAGVHRRGGQDLPDAGVETVPVELTGSGERSPDVGRLARHGEVAHGGLDPGQGLVEPAVGRRPQREDVQVRALVLKGKDLGDHEGLREPGVHLQDVADPGWRAFIRHGGPLPEASGR
jgi:hypothetical protein